VDFSKILYILLTLTTIGLVTFTVIFEYVQSKLSELVSVFISLSSLFLNRGRASGVLYCTNAMNGACDAFNLAMTICVDRVSGLGHCMQLSGAYFVITMLNCFYTLGRHSTSAHYSKMTRDEDDSDAASEGVAFVDTESFTTTKNSSSSISASSPQFMNALYYLFVLSVFTMTGLFGAFLFYKIP